MDKSKRKKKVLIALSGGIDSAVSAYLLLKQGYRVEAAFMKNWTSTEGLLKNDCPWLLDRQDALRVAAFLRIPLHTIDFEEQYQNRVMKYFFVEYKKGRTPNPDVMCNKEIKFKLLYNWAMRRGFDYLATGHYASIGKKVFSRKSLVVSRRPNDYRLVRSVDEFKDQTYFIYNIKPRQLPHLMFPVGGMKKSAVRTLARKIGLPNAEKKESMGLCFVGKIRLKDFLEQKLKERPGDIVDITDCGKLRGVHPTKQSLKGKGNEIASSAGQSPGLLAISDRVIGTHSGLHNYTIGQRQGIKVGATGPYYVVKKDLKHNRLLVTNNPNDPALMVKEVDVHSMNWISAVGTGLDLSLQGRFRHQGELVPMTLQKISRDNYHVTFKHPQKALASGQSLVLYAGKTCLGGGIIV